MREFMAITKALADQNRVRVLLALRSGELCVCQLIEFLGLAPSTVSKHMSILRNARLVDSRKMGRWVHYRLNSDPCYSGVQNTLAWLFRFLSESPFALKDKQLLKQVLEQHPQELCRMQSRKKNGKFCCASPLEFGTKRIVPDVQEKSFCNPNTRR